MVTLTTAEDALKTVYLGVVSEQLNTNANPLLNKIKQSTADVWGKEIIKLAPYGINGGIGAGGEVEALPAPAENKYVQFKSELKNLYGTIEISDKAIRSSQSNSGAFVNLLNAEMEGLIKASTFNLGRMLYGDGKGWLGTTVSNEVGSSIVKVNSTKNFMEGMIINFFFIEDDEFVPQHTCRIVYVDRVNNNIHVDKPLIEVFVDEFYITLQNSKDKEITGLGRIFDDSDSIYGLSKITYPWLNPYKKEDVGIISDEAIQEAIDHLDEYSGSSVDIITCSSFVKRAYQSYLNTFRRNIDYMDLSGGYKAISYGGIPLLSDRFVGESDMYLLNSKEFTMHQLCDFQWLEGQDGRIIRQKEGYPVYSATLVKYADLICDKPNGQAKLSGITGGVLSG